MPSHGNVSAIVVYERKVVGGGHDSPSNEEARTSLILSINSGSSLLCVDNEISCDYENVWCGQTQ